MERERAWLMEQLAAKEAEQVQLEEVVDKGEGDPGASRQAAAATST